MSTRSASAGTIAARAGVVSRPAPNSRARAAGLLWWPPGVDTPEAQEALLAWAERYGLRYSGQGECLCWLRRRPRECGVECQPGWLDHVSAWSRDRRPAVLTAHPCHLRSNDHAHLRALRAEGMTVVLGEPGWYGRGTEFVQVWAKGRVMTAGITPDRGSPATKETDMPDSTASARCPTIWRYDGRWAQVPEPPEWGDWSEEALQRAGWGGPDNWGLEPLPFAEIREHQADPERWLIAISLDTSHIHTIEVAGLPNLIELLAKIAPAATANLLSGVAEYLDTPMTLAREDARREYRRSRPQAGAAW